MTDRYIDKDGNGRIGMFWEGLLPEGLDDGEWDELNDPYMLKAEVRLREALKREKETEEQAEVAQAQNTLNFTNDELDQYVTFRTKGIAQKSPLAFLLFFSF